MSPRMACATAALLLGLAAPGRAAAYVRSTVPSGDPANPGPGLFWCTRQPPFVLNEKGSTDAGAEASLSAVRRSFATWTEPSCTDLSFADRGTTARTDVGYLAGAADNVDLVVWRPVSCASVVPSGDACLRDGGCNNAYGCWEQADNTIAITTTTYDRSTGQILDSDIELNGAGFVFTTVDSPVCSGVPPRGANQCVATDVQNTVTHEIGHFIGLDHSPDPDATMYASESLGELKKRVLGSDDIDGLCAIYPRGVAASTTCPQLQASDAGAGGGGGQGGCGCRQSAGLSSLLAFWGSAWALGRRRRTSPP